MPLENTDRYVFRYVRTAAGKLSGPSMVIQTEQALSELGNTALDSTIDALTMAEQALTNSENAVNIANSAQADASEALTIAMDARERAINANDVAQAAEKLADQAEADAQAAQNAAEKAQSTAEYAQDTAEEAFQLARQADTNATTAQSTAETADAKADTAQETADEAKATAKQAQETADSAVEKAEAAQQTADSAEEKADTAQSGVDNNYNLIINLGDEIANLSETLGEQIQQEGFYFEVDDATTDVDSIVTLLVKKYLTKNITTAPYGTSSPYWFWNFIRSDNLSCVQWLRTLDGTLYSRDGNVSNITLNTGTQSFPLTFSSTGDEFAVSLSAGDGNTLSWASESSASIGTQSYSEQSATCTITVDLGTTPQSEDYIVCDGAILGTFESATEFVPDTGMTYNGEHASVSIASGNISGTTLTLNLSARWIDYTPGNVEWAEWATLSGGDVSSSTLAVQIVGATPNCYRRAALPEAHQTYITVFANTQVNIDGKGYVSTQDMNLSLDDVATASNRAGMDMYIYACVPTAGSEPVFVLSLNSTVPDGYTADNSRKIGGFHCLCEAVGTISGHELSGFAKGDVLPTSVWDLRHRAVCENEGMLYDSRGLWWDIYLASWDGEKLVSVFGGSPVTGTSTKPMHGEMFNEEFGRVGKRLFSRDEYVVAARGTLEQDVDRLGELPSSVGGHTLSKGYRAISNIGIEDPFGVYYQWTSNCFGAFNSIGTSTTYQYGGGATNIDSYVIQGMEWDESSRIGNDAIDGDRGQWGNNYGVMGRFHVGGCGTTAQVNCGSRCVSMNGLSADVSSNLGGRGAAERRVVSDV